MEEWTTAGCGSEKQNVINESGFDHSEWPCTDSERKMGRLAKHANPGGEGIWNADSDMLEIRKEETL
ncbi:hypothetical protein GCM10028868_11570 [Virgibacillus kimchii]